MFLTKCAAILITRLTVTEEVLEHLAHSSVQNVIESNWIRKMAMSWSASFQLLSC